MKLFGVMSLLLGLFMFTTACNSSGSGSGDEDTTLVKMKVEVSSETASEVNDFLQSYFRLKNVLVEDDVEAAPEKSKDLWTQINQISVENIEDEAQRKEVEQEVLNLRNLISLLQEDTSLADIRTTFEDLSYGTYSLIKSAGLKDATVYRTYCPMAFDDKGAYWLSESSSVTNPYFGHQMINCGEVKETMEF